MDFFDHQHRARRVSAVLLLLFFLVTTFFIAVFTYIGGMFGGAAGAAATGIAVLLIVLIGSFLEWRRLTKGGGHAIAKRVGAKRLFIYKSTDALNTGVNTTADASDTSNSLSRHEQKLLHAVENMSIASGMRMPATFVMPHEQGINAFVAGFKEHDMVLVTTQGAIEQLNEEELYGLIGHEFSHIAHGDTRINLRLLIMIGGLQLLYEIASSLLYSDDLDSRHTGWSKGSTLSSRSTTSSDEIVGVFLFGWVILIVSSIGVFCARLIKYAVSRQREFLADAASVQYTRSFGVLNTLVKLRNSTLRGSIKHPSAESISHFFFAKAMSPTSWFSGLLSTHPPIDKRIEKLNPALYRRIQVQDRIRTKAEIRRVEQETSLLPELQDASRYRQPSNYDGKPVDFITSNFTGAALATEYVDTHALSEQATANDIANQTTETLPIRKRELAQHYKHDQRHTTYIPPFIVAQAIEEGTRGCLSVIAAALACHQQTRIVPEDYEVSRLLFDAIKADARQHDIWLIRKALENKDFVNIPPKAISLYLQRLYRIITIDNHVSILEQLLLDQISYKFGFLTNVLPHKEKPDIADAFSQVVDAVLIADGQHPQDIVQIKQRMLRLAGLQSTQDDAAFHKAVNLGQSLSILATQGDAMKKTLTDTLETTMLANGEISLDEQHILSLFSWRLHVALL